MSTYKQLIYRAAFEAHKFEPDTALDRLLVTAEAIFPSVVEELAQAIAADLNHPWRSLITGITSALASGAAIPSTATNTKNIIGKYGIVRDATNGRPLTEVFTLSEIRRLNENPNTWRKIDVYAYAIVKPAIYHTRTTITIDVCTLSEADIATAIAADAVPLFPDAEGAYVTALVKKLLAGNSKFDANDFGQLTSADQLVEKTA